MNRNYDRHHAIDSCLLIDSELKIWVKWVSQFYRKIGPLAELTDEESEIVEEYINENDQGENEAEAKLTFEQFLELMKENETMQKLILNIAKQKVPK